MAWQLLHEPMEPAFRIGLYCDNCGQKIMDGDPGCVAWTEANPHEPQAEPLRFVHQRCYDAGLPAMFMSPLSGKLRHADLVVLHQQMLAYVMPFDVCFMCGAKFADHKGRCQYAVTHPAGDHSPTDTRPSSGLPCNEALTAVHHTDSQEEKTDALVDSTPLVRRPRSAGPTLR